MSYRPIADVWMLAHPKLKDGVKYYGAYPAGFLERARTLLGCGLEDPVLHVCGGMARLYPYVGFGPYDSTLDLDPATEPDFLQDARNPWPASHPAVVAVDNPSDSSPWDGIIIDPPYSKVDAEQYVPGAGCYPKPAQLLKRAFEVLPVGRRVGLLHHVVPRVPPGGKQVAYAAVIVGCNSRIRCFSVIEKREEVE